MANWLSEAPSFAERRLVPSVRRSINTFTISWLICLALSGIACRPFESSDSSTRRTEAAASTSEQRQSRPIPASSHLQIRGESFYTTDARFDWRGISAFRLAEMIAHGREAESIAFLDWAQSRRLTVVRVLLMAHHLFQLKPEEGLQALPRLLELAAKRGLYVEIVALADTSVVKVDYETHLKAVGTIAAGHGNAVVEIANEPWHPTQDKQLHDPAFTKRLALLIPEDVPVALGSGDSGYAEGRYATWHSPRGTDAEGWQHVVSLAEGAELLAKWRKPLISDEPIGADAQLIPGKRDNAPERFRAAAALTRLVGLGATFHYEGGLQARIPVDRELECLEAWNAGLDLLRSLPEGGQLLSGDQLSKQAAIAGMRAAFGREYPNELWLLAIDPGPGASVKLADGWNQEIAQAARGVRVYHARR
jgi:hypothetical protein